MGRMKEKKALPATRQKELLALLEARFEANSGRHKGVGWEAVQSRLLAQPAKLWSLNEMEISGGEPDVVGIDSVTDEIIFSDCSAETPKGRTSLCYDREALDSRKQHKPRTSAMELAAAMGIEILSEQEYRDLQGLGGFDQKTSSWVITPDDIRRLGGALFGDRRFGRVFFYHNGAESYFGARGFRGSLRV